MDPRLTDMYTAVEVELVLARRDTEHLDPFVNSGMSTSRSILVQRLKETVGLSKATYDEALAECR